MKRIMATIIAALITLTAVIIVPVSATDKKSGDWLYYTWVYEDTGDIFSIITGYTGSESAVTVPAVLAGCPVLGLEKETFNKNDRVTSITLSEGIIAVWDGAINYCTNLKTVSIPKSCVIFTGESIRICGNLQSINVSSGNPSFYSQIGVLYEVIDGGTKLIEYPSGKTDSYFSIPQKVTMIDSNAFDCCFYLDSITLPPNLEYIGEGAFSSCTGLKEITIPKSVKSIGISPFSLCSSLENISVAKDNSMFCSENGIWYSKDMSAIIQYPVGKSDKIFIAPSTVTLIAPSAFCGCNNLTFVNISSVGIIYFMAFWDCKNLEEIVLSNSLNSIGVSAFGNCSSLTNVCYWGTAKDIADLTIDEGNDYLLNASLIYLPIPGDVTLDLKINAKDVTALMKYLIGNPPESFEMGAADFNGDGKVNAKDVTAIMKYIVKGGK